MSLGINNIPYKKCTYSCVYCQLGRTIELTVDRRSYSDPNEIVKAVKERLNKVDYVTFVPDGEPTLDRNLGKSIRVLKKELGVRIAVLTNASLLWMEEVREDLMDADVVSLKIDAAYESTWKRVNRPHPKLSFAELLEGMRAFVGEFQGEIIMETMLVENLNDGPGEIIGIAQLIAHLSPKKAYVAVPTRPPAEAWVRGAPPEAYTALYEELRSRGVEAELLITDEPIPPKSRKPVEFIISTTLVHPLRLDYVTKLLEDAEMDPDSALREILRYPNMKIVEYKGKKFLVNRPKKIEGGSQSA